MSAISDLIRDNRGDRPFRQIAEASGWAISDKTLFRFATEEPITRSPLLTTLEGIAIGLRIPFEDVATAAATDLGTPTGTLQETIEGLAATWNRIPDPNQLLVLARHGIDAAPVLDRIRPQEPQ